MSDSLRDRLVVIGGGGEGQQFPLKRPVVSIGRSSTNDVCLPWDLRVSRFHAQLIQRNGAWLLEDLGSTNGTYLETERIQGPIPLQHGARIRAGRIWLQLRMDPVMPTTPPSAPQPAAVPQKAAAPVPQEAAAPQFASFEGIGEEPVVAKAPAEQVVLPAPVAADAVAAAPVVAPTAPVEAAPPAPAPSPPPPPAVAPAAPPAAPMSSVAPPAPIPARPPERAVRPGLLTRLWRWLRRSPAPASEVAQGVQSTATVTPPPVAQALPEMPPAPAPQPAAPLSQETTAAVLSSQAPFLQLEIQALACDPDQPTDTDALKKVLAELDLPAHLQAQMKETLGSADVSISLTAPAGTQGDLLTFAGRIVTRLTELPDYRDVLVRHHSEGE